MQQKQRIAANPPSHHGPGPCQASQPKMPTEKELQISPIVTESVMHNTKVSFSPPHDLSTDDN